MLSSCTVVGNLAVDSGGNIQCFWGGTMASMVNSIVRGGGPDQIDVANGVLDVRWTNVEGGWPGEGNIDADPLFRSYRGFDYLLAPGSPSIDTGDPTIEDGIWDRHPRWPRWYPNGARSDMGAYGGPENAGWLAERP